MSRGRMRLQTDENWLDMHADRWRYENLTSRREVVALLRAPVRHEGDSDAPGRLRAGGQAWLWGSDRQADWWEMAAGSKASERRLKYGAAG